MTNEILYLRIEETKQVYEIYPTKAGGIKVNPVKETNLQAGLTISEKDFNKYCAIARLTDFETGFKHYIRAYENSQAWAMEDLLKGLGKKKHKSIIATSTPSINNRYYIKEMMAAYGSPTKTTTTPWPPKVFIDEANDHVDALSYVFRNVTLKRPEFAASISNLLNTKDPL